MLLVPGVVSAQTYAPLLDTDIPVAMPSQRNRTVLERPHPELAPLGVTVGGFRLYPVVGLEAGYTSNALGSAAGARQDAILSFNPAVRVESQWSRHALSAGLDYDARRYATVTAKNQDGWRTRAEGRLDIHGDSNLLASLTYERAFEDQYIGSFPANAGASIAVRHSAALLRGTFVANRLRLLASGDVDLALGIQPQDVDRIEKSDDLAVETGESTMGLTVFLDTTKGPMADVGLREAVEGLREGRRVRTGGEVVGVVGQPQAAASVRQRVELDRVDAELGRALERLERVARRHGGAALVADPQRPSTRTRGRSGPPGRTAHRWHPGHHEVVRLSSPIAALRIVVPQRGHGRPCLP